MQAAGEELGRARAITGAETARSGALLRASVAFVWLATGLLVVHPYYREVGAGYLARLSMPSWLMPATCAAEVALALRVLRGPSPGWLTAMQGAAVVGFTIILVWLEPMLLANPFGVLTKNLPLLGVLAAAHLVEREGWSRRAFWVLRASMAVIWLTEGFFPKILFQQPVELAIVERVGLGLGDPSTSLRAIGVLQIGSGLLALSLSGRPLRWLWLAQAGALLALMAVMTTLDPLLWVHPFGPLTKTIPLIAGTLVLWRRSYSC